MANMVTAEYSEDYLRADRAWIIFLINILFLVLAIVFVGLRIYTRVRLLPGTHGAEDWLLVSACVSYQ